MVITYTRSTLHHRWGVEQFFAHPVAQAMALQFAGHDYVPNHPPAEATPEDLEMEVSGGVVAEQLIRLTNVSNLVVHPKPQPD